MQNISTYKRYFNKQIEFDNSEAMPEPVEYELTFPHSYDSSWTYKIIYAEAVKSQVFIGSIKAEFVNIITDSDRITYEKPVIVQQVDNPSVNLTGLDESSAGTYRLLDTSLDKLVIRVTQVTPGSGKIIFVIRGL